MTNKEILHRLKHFFPNDAYKENTIEKLISTKEIITDREYLRNALKVAMLDESVAELEIGGYEKTFLCRIMDNPPEPVDIEEPSNDKESDQSTLDPEYNVGSYLESFDHIIITPLEPAMGNFLIASEEQQGTPLVLRILTHNNAVELGCFFKTKLTLTGSKLLQLSFPDIARFIKGARELRVKVPVEMEVQVYVKRRGTKKNFTTTPLDISLNDMGLLNPYGKHSDIRMNERVHLELSVPNKESIAVEATVRHVTKIRQRENIQYCIGVHFNLTKKVLAVSMQKTVSMIQRYHLRMLSDLSQDHNVDYSDW